MSSGTLCAIYHQLVIVILNSSLVKQGMNKSRILKWLCQSISLSDNYHQGFNKMGVSDEG